MNSILSFFLIFILFFSTFPINECQEDYIDEEDYPAEYEDIGKESMEMPNQDYGEWAKSPDYNAREFMKMPDYIGRKWAKLPNLRIKERAKRPEWADYYANELGESPPDYNNEFEDSIDYNSAGRAPFLNFKSAVPRLDQNKKVAENVNANENDKDEDYKAQGIEPPVMESTTRPSRQLPDAPIAYNDSGVEPEWRLRMVHNLHWDWSKNFLAVFYTNLQSQTFDTNSEKQISVIGPYYYPTAGMSFFHGLDYPNMLIRFKYAQNGAAYCEYGQVKESFLHKIKNQNELNKWKEQNCLFKRKKVYPNELNDANLGMQTHIYPICPIRDEEEFTWRIANGKYNPPSRTPHCLYDFYLKARETDEYILLKYCAKAYFYNGLDYNESNKREKNKRKDWLLYLAEGQLSCGMSGDFEKDADLLAKGYTLELVHYASPHQMVHVESTHKCPPLKATLVAYKDKEKSGKFIIAAVVGAAQLDGEFRWPYRKEGARFWDKETYLEKYKYMNFDEKACYIFYQSQLTDLHTKRYNLELQISHFCTGRGMRKRTRFNVALGPEQVHGDGVFEDKGIHIDLFAGRMRRSTGQTLCAIKSKNSLESPCEMPPPTKNDQIAAAEHFLPLQGKCDETYQCQEGMRCRVYLDDVCSKLSEPQSTGRRKNTCKRIRPSDWAFCAWTDNNLATLVEGSENRQIGCIKDFRCREDEYCAHCEPHEGCGISTGECRRLRFLGEGEPCYVDMECYPKYECAGSGGGLANWGKCQPASGLK